MAKINSQQLFMCKTCDFEEEKNTPNVFSEPQVQLKRKSPKSYSLWGIGDFIYFMRILLAVTYLLYNLEAR